MSSTTLESGNWFERLRIEAIATAPTLLVSISTAIAFLQVFGTWEFLWPMIGTAGLVHVWGAVVRSSRPALLVGLLSPAVSILCSVGWLRFGRTLSFGLPLSATWSQMASELRSAWDLLGDVVTPVEFTTGFGTMAMVVIGFVAAVTDSFAARYGGRIEVFVPSAATLFIVATVGTGHDRLEISTLWLMTALLAAVLIRRNRIRRATTAQQTRSAPRTAIFRSVIGSTVFIVFVGVIAHTFAPRLPGAGDEAWLTQRAGPGNRELRPLVDIRRQLTDPSTTVLFSVRADAPSYWRVTGLSDFDGSTWTISQRRLDSASGALTPPIGANDPGVDSVTNVQRFAIDSLSGNLIPIAATPTRLRSSTKSLYFESDSGTLLMGEEGLNSGDVYEMESTMISPRTERLLRATVESPPDDSFLTLPDTGSITRVRDMARSVAPVDLSPYERALALQDYFRSEFTYSLDVPPLDGDDATLEFLERRTGYCEHFASTFAIFARTLGLPARVAIGFTPGDRTRTDAGQDVYTVRARHAHAWPEVWFDGLGWVLFEPTPGRGAPNAGYTNVPEVQNDEPAPQTTAPPTTIATTVPTGVTTLPPASGGDAPNTEPHSSHPQSSWPAVTLVVVLSIAIVWLVAAPRILRSFVLRRNDPTCIVLWRKAVALYELERGKFSTSLSPQELARHATSRLYDEDTFIFELAQIASASMYGSSELSSHESEDLDRRGRDYLMERRRRLPWHLRVRARVDPIAMWRLEGGSPTR